MDEGTIKTPNPKWIVYRLEIQSVVFSTPLVICCPLYLLSDLPHQPPHPSQRKRTIILYTDSVRLVRGCGGGC
jgi:hypothetical protein